MITLYLNDRQVLLPTNVNFKLVKENPYFTKSSSYTFDIALPLEGCSENLMIFKHINRHDVTKEQQTLKAKLVVDCKCLLNGTAVVKSISEKDVKIQLISGNSEFNFFSKGSKIYINELDLGYVVPDMRFTSVPASHTTPAHLKGRFYHEIHNNTVLFYPVWDETNERVINDYNLLSEETWYKHKGPWSPQTKLSIVIRKVFEKLGYLVDFDLNEDFPIEHIYIANTESTNNADRDGITGSSAVPMYLNRALPHWTVNQFLEQLELFFGVTSYVDEYEKKVVLVQNGKVTGINDDTYLDNVTDGYTAEFDKDNQDKDLANGNIGYDSDFSNDAYKYIKIDDDLFNKMKAKSYETYEDLKNAVGSYNAFDAQFVHEAESKQYTFIDSENTGKGLFEINQFRNLYRDEENKELDIELKIVPCSMAIHKLDVYLDSFEKEPSYTRSVLIPSLQGQSPGTLTENATIQDMVEGEAVELFSPDKLNVFYWDGKYFKTTGAIAGTTTSFPAAITDKGVCDTLTAAGGESEFSFRLVAPEGMKCWGNMVYRPAVKVNQTAKEVKKFISKSVYSPNGVFVIKNKRYLCQQIQANITAKGIDELQEFTGYQLIE